MPYCIKCPGREGPGLVSLQVLQKHVAKHHPEVIDESMPVCPNCGMRAEAGRHPQTGWHCNWCGTSTSQRLCPTCGSLVDAVRLTDHRTPV